jgi:hypothetical protein
VSALIEFIRPSNGAPARMATPEDLVSMAAAIGGLQIQPDSYGSRAWKAEIHFVNRNGSRVWAAGTDANFFTAIAKAIQEAERLR